MTLEVQCRAQVTRGCLNGQPQEPDSPSIEDGTYQPDNGTIVCDACYVALMPYTPSGRGLNHELAGAIAFMRSRPAH